MRGWEHQARDHNNPGRLLAARDRWCFITSMTRPGGDDPDPIANTEMFRRFVDEDFPAAAGGPNASTPSNKSKLLTVFVPILAAVVVIVVVLFVVL